MRKSTDIIFHVGMGIKGVDAIFEVVGGILLTMPTRLARYITVLAEHEAFRHHEALAGRLSNMAGSVTMHPSMFEAGYLLVHGLAKSILIAAIFANRKWGYVGLFWVLGLFASIELIRSITAHEVVTGAFAAFDAVLVVLIYKEYRSRFAQPAFTPDRPAATIP